MAYTLVNKTVRIQTVVLDHPLAKRTGRFLMKSNHDPRTGKVTQRREFVTAAGSLTLLGGETRAGLPNWYREIPDIRRKVRSGDLELIRENEPEPTAPRRRKRARKKAQE